MWGETLAVDGARRTPPGHYRIRTGAQPNVPAPNQADPGHSPAQTVGRLASDGKRVYRMTAPMLVWWGWVAFALVGLGDLIVQGHTLPSLRVLLGGLTATGMFYAFAFWPRVIADDDGICVRNPVRIFDIPWQAVTGVFLAEMVEVECARAAPRKAKTVACWALASSRRSRARAQLRGWQWDRGVRGRPPSYDKLPESAREVMKMPQAELIARELASLSDAAVAASDQSVSAPADQPVTVRSGTMSARWAWQPIAAIVVPGIAFAIFMAV